MASQPQIARIKWANEAALHCFGPRGAISSREYKSKYIDKLNVNLSPIFASGSIHLIGEMLGMAETERG